MRHEPIVTDKELDAMRISSFPEIGELQDRCLRYAENPPKPKFDDIPPWRCFEGCSPPSFWIVETIRGNDFARPCPIHFPDYIPPEHREIKKQKNEEIREKKKQEVKEWMD